MPGRADGCVAPALRCSRTVVRSAPVLVAPCPRAARDFSQGDGFRGGWRFASLAHLGGFCVGAHAGVRACSCSRPWVLMQPSVRAHAVVHEGSCRRAWVLMQLSVLAHAAVREGSCNRAWVLMQSCVTAHATVRGCSCNRAWVLMQPSVRAHAIVRGAHAAVREGSCNRP